MINRGKTKSVAGLVDRDEIQGVVGAMLVDNPVALWVPGLTGGALRNVQTYDGYTKGLGPVAYWQLNEAVGASTLVNCVDNQYDLIAYGGLTIGATGLIAGSDDTAVSSDGSGQYAKTDYSAGLGSAAFTVSMRVNLSATGVNHNLYHCANGSTDGFYIRVDTNNKVRIVTGDSGASTLVASTALSSGTTYTVHAGHDGTDAFIYLDGASDATPATQGYAVNTSQATTIGGSPSGGSDITGTVGRVSLFDYALSEDEAAAQHWLAESVGTATLAGDALIGGSGPVAGSSALVLDGTGDYASTAYSAALSPAVFTVGALVNPSAIGSAMNIYASGNGTTDGFVASVLTTGEVSVTTNDGSGNTLNADTPMVADTWNYAAAGNNATNTAIYLNGVSDATPTAKGYTAGASVATGIGATAAGVAPFSGSIGVVALFNKELSAAQVLAHYLAL